MKNSEPPSSSREGFKKKVFSKIIFRFEQNVPYSRHRALRSSCALLRQIDIELHASSKQAHGTVCKLIKEPCIDWNKEEFELDYKQKDIH